MKKLTTLIVMLFLIFIVYFTVEKNNSFKNIINSKNFKSKTWTYNDIVNSVKERNGYYLNIAVLYKPTDDNYTKEATVEYLKQSLVIGLNVFDINVDNKDFLLDGYDAIFLDESIEKCENRDFVISKVMNYTQKGGNVLFASNIFEYLTYRFMGSKKFFHLDEAPFKICIPKTDKDLLGLQEVIKDFAHIYKDYNDIDFIKERDYGHVMVPNTAVVLAEFDKKAIYTINKYGKGTVLFVNPLLPNKYSKSSFTFGESKQKQAPFANTTATFNQLFYSNYLSYISKQIYGFSINRVFGYYGTPSMSWSLHYENIEGIKINALQRFSEMVEKYNQIPSYSLVRNAITWFLRTETITYMLNISKNNKKLEYRTDLYENPFSSGIHVSKGDSWLQIKSKNIKKSGIGGNFDERLQLYPSLTDYNRDGLVDLISGSSDGRIYYYKNLGFKGKDGRLAFDEAKILDVKVDGFSSPIFTDIDGDGIFDIISGSQDGNIYYFKGLGNLKFADAEILIKTDIQGKSLPRIGDINHDGVDDIVVGSDTGVFLVYYGQKEGKKLSFSYKNMSGMSRQLADWGLGKYLSPYVVDYNNDGINDLIIGTEEGYVAKLKGSRNGYSFDGYIQSDEMNILGNYNLKFGMFANPVLIDLNNDKKLDIIVGYEDTGFPYPIDSVYFPYKRELMEQIEYVKNKHYYVGLHHFTGWYASPQRQKYELKAHIKALKEYGLINNIIGMNQHAGPISKILEKDAFDIAFQSGMKWNSFFESKEHAFQNWAAAETAVVNPFFLVNDGKRTMLMQNIQSALPCYSNRLSCSKDWIYTTAKYESPVLNYHHPDDMDVKLAKEIVYNAETFRKKFKYNFMKEDQMMKAIAAAYNLTVSVDANDGILKINPVSADNNMPLYDENAQSAAGIKVEFSSHYKGKYSTDAVVWSKSRNTLYAGLDREISILPYEKQEKQHLLRVNVPAKISVNDDGVDISFLDDGLMQAVVKGRAFTKDSHWKSVYENGETTFTAFGEKRNLQIIFGR